MQQQPRFDAPAADWLVYADTLEQAGDVRGPLIALNDSAARGEKVAERDAYVTTHAEALLGGVSVENVTVKWGLVADEVTVRAHSAEQAAADVSALLGSPVASLMRRLSLRGLTPSPLESLELSQALAAIASSLPPTCTELALVDDRADGASTMVASYYDRNNNLVDFGTLEPVWSIEQLESLSLVVADPMQLDLGEINAPSLRRFALLGLVWADAIHDEASELSGSLAAASWPQLEHFELRLPETFTCSVPDNDGAYIRCARYDEDQYEDEGWDEGQNEGTDWNAELSGVLTNLAGTQLSHLGLHSFDSTRSLLEALAQVALPQLKTLDLSESELGDRDVAWMLEHRELFASLDLLDLNQTRISERAAKTLDGLGPKVLHSRGGAVHRFLVGME